MEILSWKKPNYKFPFFLKILPNINDFRQTRGKRYILGHLLFCLLLTEFKNCHRQRQRSRWLEGHWDWLSQLWTTLTGQKTSPVAPSQSTLSRILNRVDFWSIKQQFFNALFLYEKNKKPDLSLDLIYSQNDIIGLHKTSLNHYAIDGKSRKGIESLITGRTEIDLSIFDVKKNQVIATHHLADKEGESTKATEIVKKLSGKIAPGIFTGDAGFLSPKFISTLFALEHQYIIGLKGNAGEAHDVCLNLNWNNFPVLAKTYDKNHGREEIRELKRSFILPSSSKVFSKYEGGLYLYHLESKRIIKGKSSTEIRFFIGSKGLKGLPPKTILNLIRNHWKQENCLHWVKDKVLGEDNLPKMHNRSSRVLGFLKDIVVAVGHSLYKSVQKFVDMFDASPEKITRSLLKLN